MSALRVCNDCGLEANTEEDLPLFVKTTGRMKYGRRNQCYACREKKRKEQDTPEKRRKKMEWYVKNEYGVSLEFYEEKMSRGECDRCGSTSNLCYDHDHYMPKGEEAFRGILCDSCNRGIGLLGDTLEDIEETLKYMRRFYNGEG